MKWILFEIGSGTEAELWIYKVKGPKDFSEIAILPGILKTFQLEKIFTCINR